MQCFFIEFVCNIEKKCFLEDATIISEDYYNLVVC